MSDPEPQRRLADNPASIASPNDLHRRWSPRRAPLESRPRRPLLDLFPVTSFEPDDPPPWFGGAVGPQLPFAPVAEPERPSSHADGVTGETFYGSVEKLFNVSAIPRFYYRSAEHERATIDLLAAMRTRGGPAVLTGAPGIGKTTLCRALVQQLDRRSVASIVDSPQSIDDLLKAVLVDFGVVAPGDASLQLTRDVLGQALGSFLDSLILLKASAVVFIDEAQQVPVSVLGDIGMLASGSPAAEVLQIVLVGQPTLNALLRHAHLRSLNESIARRTELGPLRADEISAYVTHRLSTGVGTRIEFDNEAIERLFDLSQGTPRAVNLLIDRATTHGDAASAAVISSALIDGADDLDPGTPDSEGRGALSSFLTAIGFALLFVAGAAVALYVSREAVSRTIHQWEDVPQPPGRPAPRLPAPLASIPPSR